MNPTNLSLAALMCVVLITNSSLVWSASDEILAWTARQALKQGDTGAAQRALERLRYNGAITTEQRLELARLYQRQGRWDAARAELDLIQANKAGLEVLLLRADLAAQDGDWTLVRDLTQQVVAREPDHAEGHLRLGQALQELGEQSAADEAYSRYADLTSSAQH